MALHAFTVILDDKLLNSLGPDIHTGITVVKELHEKTGTVLPTPALNIAVVLMETTWAENGDTGTVETREGSIRVIKTQLPDVPDKDYPYKPEQPEELQDLLKNLFGRINE